VTSPTPTPLTKAYDDAVVRRDTRALRDLLARGSGLPGPRINQALVDAFAEESRSRGAAADRLLVELASLDAFVAPGATPLEMLPVCGVAGAAARAAQDDAALERGLALLHDRADDLRFRVRDAVALGLARIGARRGAALADAVASWMDGFFHAAAVVRALADPAWLAALPKPEAAVARLDEAFELAHGAQRSAARYPGHKALVEALSASPRTLAERFGVPVFDLLERWAQVKDPVLREVVEKNLGGARLAGRHAAEVARVRAALARTAPPRRDPRTDVGPTRGRGKRRQR
jgi:hypothetical protein